MRVSADIPPGKVPVIIDFSAWPTLARPHAVGEITVRKLPVVPKHETISSRLIGTWQHPDRNSSFSSLCFSKDGKRLWAGGYPEGNVVVYDAANGTIISQIETGKSWRGSSDYVHVTPDERSMLVIKERYPKIEHFVKDNQPMVRFLPNNGSIRRWNLETGELLWADSRLDQCRVVTFVLSPTGKFFVIEEEPPGELPRGNQPKRRGMYGETSTGKIYPLPAGLSGFGIFSQDGKYFATYEKTPDNQPKSIKLLDGERFQELGRWPIQESFSDCEFKALTPDRLLIYRQLVLPRKGDWKNATSRMMMLDVSKTDAQPQVIAPNVNSSVSLLTLDNKRLLHLHKNGERYELRQIELANPSRVRATPLPSDPKHHYGSSSALSHDGRFLAIAQWADIPKELDGEDEIKPEQIGQPRIILIETATGKVVETLVSPHAFLAGFAFSPDNRRLVSSGQGCVHVWDISGLK